MVKLPSVDRFDGKQRLAIGAGLVLATKAMVATQVGIYRLGGYLQLLAWAFLGTAFLPLFVSRANADEWDDISTMKQLGILWVAGVGALVLWFAISSVSGAALDFVV